MNIKKITGNGSYEKPHLIYDHTAKKLKLQTNSLKKLKVGNLPSSETSIILLNSLNGKRVVFWLTKKGAGRDVPPIVVKASISNYSSTLTLNSALASQSNHKFQIFSEDTVIHKVMYSPSFYDFDSKQYHKIMIKEKLNGSYIL